MRRETASRLPGHFWFGEEFVVCCNVFEDGALYPLHCHEYHELSLTLEGTLTQWRNGRRERIPSRGLCLVSPDDAHELGSAKGDGRVVMLNCEFSGRLRSEAEAFLATSGLVPPAGGWGSAPLRNLPADVWQGLVGKARGLAFGGRSLPKPVREAAFKSLLVDALAQLACPERGTTGSSPHWLDKLRDAMQEEANFVAGLPRMLELAGHGQEYLNRLMRRHYGETPTEFINQLRVRKAAEMLAAGRFAAGRVMADCGFGQYSWFLNCFRRHFGMTPRQYLKLVRQPT